MTQKQILQNRVLSKLLSVHANDTQQPDKNEKNTPSFLAYAVSFPSDFG